MEDTEEAVVRNHGGLHQDVVIIVGMDGDEPV